MDRLRPNSQDGQMRISPLHSLRCLDELAEIEESASSTSPTSQLTQPSPTLHPRLGHSSTQSPFKEDVVDHGNATMRPTLKGE
jgi:hypothetical protein